MPELVGVGHICQDHLRVVEAYPPEDGSTRITDVDVQGGGAVATAIVAAARLGVAPALIGNLGVDRVGDEIVAELAREGVDIGAIARREDVRGLSSYVMIQPERGTRTEFPMKDRSHAIAWDQRQRGKLREAKALHLDGTHYENARRVPLVLHGGSEIPADMVRRAISLGVTKVKVNTECQLAFAGAVRRYVEQGKDLTAKGFTTRALLGDWLEAVKRVAMDKMVLFGSAGVA